MKAKEETERVLNPTIIRTRINEEGELVFSYPNEPVGEGFDIKTTKESLCDALHRTLYPLMNFKNTLDKESDDPGPLFYLLEGMLEDVAEKIGMITDAVEKEIGEIKIYQNESFRIRRGEVLGVQVKTVEV